MANKKREYFVQGEDVAIPLGDIPPMPPVSLMVDVLVMQSKLLAGLMAGLISLDDKDVYDQVRELLRFTDNICSLAEAHEEELSEEEVKVFDVFEKVLNTKATKEQMDVLESETKRNASKLEQVSKRVDDKLKGGLS